MPNIIKNHHLDMNSSLQEKQFAVESLNVLNLSEVVAVNYTHCANVVGFDVPLSG